MAVKPVAALHSNLPWWCRLRKLSCITVLAFHALITVAYADTLQIDLPSQLKKGINPISNYVSDELIIEFKDNTDQTTRGSVIARHVSHQLAALHGKKKRSRVKLKNKQNMIQAILALRSEPSVEYVQPNYIYQLQATTPNDTFFTDLWGLHNTGQNVNGSTGTAGNDVGIRQAWDHVTDCSSVVVAITDTGINTSHSDLSSNIWNNSDEIAANNIDDDGNGYIDDVQGWDFVSNDNNPMPVLASEIHGTHVAGTIGAIGNNGRGITGICWQIQLMPLRVLNEYGTGTTTDLIEALQYAIDNGANIVNMSLSTTAFDSLLNNAVSNARDNNVIIVAAAGNNADDNDSGTTRYPCSFDQDNIICVAALDQNYNLAGFSNYGATRVDVAAPGVNIKSTWPGESITDSMTGWTRSGAWSEIECLSTSGWLSLIANPSGYCGSGGYNNNANDIAYKQFDLSGFSSATLSFLLFYDTQSGIDSVTVAKKSSGGDPFSGGINIASYSGSTPNNGSSGITISMPLNSCFSSNCSIGFRLLSNASISKRGAAIASLTISSITTNSDSYELLNGTSMATPHVTGLAAMIFAFNPNNTYQQTVNAVINSGTSTASLAGKTKSGRAINALQAIRYVNPPAGPSATLN